MNYTNGQTNNLATQKADLANMQAAGVNVIRFPLNVGTEANSIALAQLAQTYGIASFFNILKPPYPGGVVCRTFNGSFPHWFGSCPWSQFDVYLYRTWLRQTLGQMLAAGITPAGIELGNEINTSAFNGDFPEPGAGQVVAGASTPAMQIIFRGFQVYARALEVTKAVRREMQMTFPIVSAGLADVGPVRLSGLTLDGIAADAVTIEASLDAMASYGLNAVDAIGVHAYPASGFTPAKRLANLQTLTFPRCTIDRPCYVTEWGFTLSSLTCPVSDTARAALTQETINNMAIFGAAVKWGMWFDWTGDNYGVYQCSALTPTGTLVLP